MLSMHLFLQGSWSSGTKGTAMLTLQLGGMSHHAEQWRNVHLTPMVLVGAGCKTAMTTGRAISSYYRVFLGLYTQLKVHQVFLVW